MTITWLEWLFEKGERNSRCYDFGEAPRIWETQWFRIGLLLLVCLGLIGFFWPRSG